MKDNKLTELSMEFSVDIISLVKKLKLNHESIISNQICRSGTSIGANIHEAQYAQGKKDFISKLEIALKEASGTGIQALFSVMILILAYFWSFLPLLILLLVALSQQKSSFVR